MLANFQLNKKRTEVASVKPDRRVAEYLAIIDTISKNEKNLKILDTIKASIDTELVSVSGKVLPLNECTMGNNQSFKINPTGEGRFDREVQKKMLTQGPM